MSRNIVLASESPQRKKILSGLGVHFTSMPPDSVETMTANPYFSQIAFENSYKKAFSVSEKYPDSLVIGADTVIEFEGKAIGKPSDIEDAFRILKSLSGMTHHVLTAVTILHWNESIRCVFGDVTEIKMKKSDDMTIKKYIDTVRTIDKAGAYAIQDNGDMLIESISGSFSNVVGLPSEKLSRALCSLGCQLAM